jgi:hypothetical protein
MATAAQIDANRRNALKSTGPRTEEGKNRSRMNGLDHGCRASILALPPEEFGEFQQELSGWKASFRPRNAAEDVLIDRIVTLGWQEKCVARAQRARLSRRVPHAGVEHADCEKDDVLELSQILFRDACGPMALHLHHDIGQICDADESPRISNYSHDDEHPSRIVHRLQSTLTGCEWLLGQWAKLRLLLEQGAAWVPGDKLKAVRLLGFHPIDAIDAPAVACVYLASHVLMNGPGKPFQEILNELSADERPTFEHYWNLRNYATLAPQDAATARAMLIRIIDYVTVPLEEKAGVLRQLAEIDAEEAPDRLFWDDTAEGERFRRYELTCKRTWLRMFDMLLKIRQSGSELDLATVHALSRSVPTVTALKTNPAVSADSLGMVPTEEPVDSADLPSEPNSGEERAPSEPNSGGEKAPSEPNLAGEAIRGAGSGGRRELRTDAPHLELKPGAIGITGNGSHLPAFKGVLSGRKQPFLDLTPIFGER